MPLPWKKAKCTRISQFVADHINSPKHGGSLVVQTGFPTSLVDLFHKNRDRLKKPSKKKRSAGSDLVLGPQLELSSLSSKKSSELDLNMAHSHTCSTNPTGDVVLIDHVDKTVEKCAEVPYANKAFVAFLKIFLVVVLALGTKRFVFGITVSAFSLFFLEYVVGGYIYNLWKLCSNPRSKLKIMAERLLCFLWIRGNKLEGKCIDSDDLGLDKGYNLNNPILDKQNLQAKSSLEPLVEEIRCVNCSKRMGIVELDSKKGVMEIGEDCKCDTSESKQVDTHMAKVRLKMRDNSDLESRIEQIRSVDFNKRLGFEEMDSKKGIMMKGQECKGEISDSKYKASGRAKIKSKMKKLVPKKLRKLKKKGSGSKNEVQDSTEEDEQKEQDCDEGVEQSEYLEDLSVLARGSSDLEKIISNESSDSCESLQMNLGADVVDSKVGSESESEWKLGYWVLCLIVLAGLVGGRLFALVLTLCLCLMLKSGEKLRRCLKL